MLINKNQDTHKVNLCLFAVAQKLFPNDTVLYEVVDRTRLRAHLFRYVLAWGDAASL